MRRLLSGYRKLLATALGSLLLMFSGVALPNDPPDPEAVKPVILNWEHFDLNALAAPEPYRFIAAVPPKPVLDQRMRDAQQCMDRLWGTTQQRKNLEEVFGGNSDRFLDSKFNSLGGTILDVQWNDIEIVGDTADVTVTLKVRFGGSELSEPSPGIWVSEQTATEHFQLSNKGGIWKVQHWDGVSGGASGEVIYGQQFSKESLNSPTAVGPAMEKARELLTVPRVIRDQLKPDLVGPYIE